jgi:hypothetical protein
MRKVDMQRIHLPFQVLVLDIHNICRLTLKIPPGEHKQMSEYKFMAWIPQYIYAQ